MVSGFRNQNAFEYNDARLSIRYDDSCQTGTTEPPNSSVPNCCFQDLGDRAVEAQACYSLGNTYTLLKDYPMAVEYHLRHLRIAQELFDKVGEGRACWSLGNAHAAMGQHQEAFHYASKHLEISKVRICCPHTLLGWLS